MELKISDLLTPTAKYYAGEAESQLTRIIADEDNETFADEIKILIESCFRDTTIGDTALESFLEGIPPTENREIKPYLAWRIMVHLRDALKAVLGKDVDLSAAHSRDTVNMIGAHDIRESAGYSTGDLSVETHREEEGWASVDQHVSASTKEQLGEYRDRATETDHKKMYERRLRHLLQSIWQKCSAILLRELNLMEDKIYDHLNSVYREINVLYTELLRKEKEKIDDEDSYD